MTRVFIPDDIREAAARCTEGLVLSRLQKREEIEFMRTIHERIATAIMAERRRCVLAITAGHRDERYFFS
ncbi:hypothetical protein [Rhizobium sp. 21-4511-3d]